MAPTSVLLILTALMAPLAVALPHAPPAVARFAGVLSYFRGSQSIGWGHAVSGRSMPDARLPESELPTDIDAVSSADECSAACVRTPGCFSFTFYPTFSETSTGTLSRPGAGVVPEALPAGVRRPCNLLTGLSDRSQPADTDPVPTASNAATRAANTRAIIGRVPSATLSDGPLLVGARGTRFVFGAALRRPFCLVTDANLHVNVLLGRRPR